MERPRLSEAEVVVLADVLIGAIVEGAEGGSISLYWELVKLTNPDEYILEAIKIPYRAKLAELGLEHTEIVLERFVKLPAWLALTLLGPRMAEMFARFARQADSKIHSCWEELNRVLPPPRQADIRPEGVQPEESDLSKTLSEQFWFDGLAAEPEARQRQEISREIGKRLRGLPCLPQYAQDIYSNICKSKTLAPLELMHWSRNWDMLTYLGSRCMILQGVFEPPYITALVPGRVLETQKEALKRAWIMGDGIFTSPIRLCRLHFLLQPPQGVLGAPAFDTEPASAESPKQPGSASSSSYYSAQEGSISPDGPLELADLSKQNDTAMDISVQSQHSAARGSGFRALSFEAGKSVLEPAFSRMDPTQSENLWEKLVFSLFGKPTGDAETWVEALLEEINAGREVGEVLAQQIKWGERNEPE